MGDKPWDVIFQARTGYNFQRQDELVTVMYGHAVEVFGGLSQLNEDVFYRRNIASQQDVEQFLAAATQHRIEKGYTDVRTFNAYIQWSNGMDDALHLVLGSIDTYLECETRRPILVRGTPVSIHNQEVRDDLTRDFGLLPGIKELWNGPKTLFVGEPYMLYRPKAFRPFEDLSGSVRTAAALFWRLQQVIPAVIDYPSMVEVVQSASGGTTEAIAPDKVAVRLPESGRERRAIIRDIGRVVEMRLQEAGVPIDWDR